MKPFFKSIYFLIIFQNKCSLSDPTFGFQSYTTNRKFIFHQNWLGFYFKKIATSNTLVRTVFLKHFKKNNFGQKCRIVSTVFKLENKVSIMMDFITTDFTITNQEDSTTTKGIRGLKFVDQ